MTTNKPVAWVTADTVEGQTVNGKPRRVWWENKEGVGTPIYAAPQPAVVPDMTSTIVNDCCWTFVKAMPHNLPGPIFNDLKPALYEALKQYHGFILTGARTEAVQADPVAYISHTSEGDVLGRERQFDAPRYTPLYTASSLARLKAQWQAELYEALKEAKCTIQALIDEGYSGYIDQRERIDRLLAKGCEK